MKSWDGDKDWKWVLWLNLVLSPGAKICDLTARKSTELLINMQNIQYPLKQQEPWRSDPSQARSLPPLPPASISFLWEDASLGLSTAGVVALISYLSPPPSPPRLHVCFFFPHYLDHSSRCLPLFVSSLTPFLLFSAKLGSLKHSQGITDTRAETWMLTGYFFIFL